MQPYINPNYLNQYQMPMYQQNQGTRFVNNFNEIQINEIPMDGKYALFAKSDMSEIQARAWNSNGTISVLEYSLKQAPKTETTENVPQEDRNAFIEPILAEIRALSERVDKLMPTSRKKVQEND